jgi:hypothetical protein
MKSSGSAGPAKTRLRQVFASGMSSTRVNIVRCPSSRDTPRFPFHESRHVPSELALAMGRSRTRRLGSSPAAGPNDRRRQCSAAGAAAFLSLRAGCVSPVHRGGGDALEGGQRHGGAHRRLARVREGIARAGRPGAGVQCPCRTGGTGSTGGTSSVHASWRSRSSLKRRHDDARKDPHVRCGCSSAGARRLCLHRHR